MTPQLPAQSHREPLAAPWTGCTSCWWLALSNVTADALRRDEWRGLAVAIVDVAQGRKDRVEDRRLRACSGVTYHAHRGA